MTMASGKIARFCLLGVLLTAGVAAREGPAGDPHSTGLIPLDVRQVGEILETWPRITHVDFNWLGFERINRIKAGKAKSPLDSRAIKPVGREVESSIGGLGASIQAMGMGSDQAGDLPPSVDNSTLKYFPPIRSQGSLGSCASFASTYYQLSYMTALQRDLDIRDGSDNTTKYSPKWSYNMVNGGTNDGSNFGENYALLAKHGAATWTEFPYDSDYRAWCLNTATWRNALGVRTKQVQYVYNVSSDAGLEQIKELLTDGYIVVFGTYITSWQFKTVTNDPSTSDDDPAVGKDVGYWLNGSEGSHAMNIVGYNDAVWTDVNSNGTIDAGEKGAFRIANSWGAGWRDAGFVWLAYDALRNPSAVSGAPSTGRIPAFQSDMVFVLTARDDYSPLMIAQFTVNHAKRNQLLMTLGRSAISATLPATEWYPGAISYQGGSYAFDGSTTAVDGTFILDLTDILTSSGSTQRFYLGMSDNGIGDTATLSAFKIIDLTTDPQAEAVSTLVPQYADGGQKVYAYVDYAWGGVNPVPHLTSLSPSKATAAGSNFTLTLAGSGFFPGSVVTWGGDSLTTTYVSDTELQAAVGANDISDGGDVQVTVVNPAPGGGTSEALAFPVDNPVPKVTSLAPAKATGGGAAFNVTLQGSEFVRSSVVRWNGADKVTTFVGRYFLQAAIPASDIAAGGEVQVTVANPAPGGGTSTAIVFPVSTFTLAPSPASVTVSAGQSATYPITLTSQFDAFGSAVSLSCTGLPKGCTGSFSPASVTPGSLGATTTLTLKTTASKSAAIGATAGPGASIFLLALLLWPHFRRPLSRQRVRRRLATAVLVCLIVIIAGCSSGGGTNGSTGTPQGTYTITVNGTSGNLTVSTTVTLVVN